MTTMKAMKAIIKKHLKAMKAMKAIERRHQLQLMDRHQQMIDQAVQDGDDEWLIAFEYENEAFERD